MLQIITKNVGPCDNFAKTKKIFSDVIKRLAIIKTYLYLFTSFLYHKILLTVKKLKNDKCRIYDSCHNIVNATLKEDPENQLLVTAILKKLKNYKTEDSATSYLWFVIKQP